MIGDSKQQILIIGAGPAGLFAARKLVEDGYRVVILNRDIKPGGLAEYGIYYDKYVIKNGLRKQFKQILALPEVEYIGNVTVGENADITLEELQELGYKTILVTAGAQRIKSLGLEGENLDGVYHAKNVVFHYNNLPPYSTEKYRIQGRVAIVGVGNVMMDVAHWAIRDLKVDEVLAIARRGPAEVKFTAKEMEHIFNNLDREDFESEMKRCAPVMETVGQNMSQAKEFILSASETAEPKVSGSKMRFRFLASPTRIIGNEKGEVIGLEIEDNKLVLKGDDTKAVGLGTKQVLDIDAVVFCIGDKVDKDLGLPTEWDQFCKNPAPLYPINGISYEAYDPIAGQPIAGIFLAGWSREASTGLVGTAKKDGECCVKAAEEYLLKITSEKTNPDLSKELEKRLRQSARQLIFKEDILKLEKDEQDQIKKLGLKDFKYRTNEEMLSVINKK
jgi:ferredoxin--NADP+ reductase